MTMLGAITAILSVAAVTSRDTWVPPEWQDPPRTGIFGDSSVFISLTGFA